MLTFRLAPVEKKNTARISFYFFLTILLSSCFFDSKEERLFKEGLKHVKASEFKKAAEKFNFVVQRAQGKRIAVDAAQYAADINLYQLKNITNAIEFSEFVVLNSEIEKDRIAAKKRLALIYFENLNDYAKAILEFNRLLALSKDEVEKAGYQIAIAKSYYYQNDFYQAEVEIEAIDLDVVNEDQKYQILLLKGNIDLAQKEVDSAIEVFTRLLNEYPESANKDNVSMLLAVSYEEKKDFARAIEVLDETQGNHEAPDFIQDRIKNLKRRQSHLPGAKGLRK